MFLIVPALNWKLSLAPALITTVAFLLLVLFPFDCIITELPLIVSLPLSTIALNFPVFDIVPPVIETIPLDAILIVELSVEAEVIVPAFTFKVPLTTIVDELLFPCIVPLDIFNVAPDCIITVLKVPVFFTVPPDNVTVPLSTANVLL